MRQVVLGDEEGRGQVEVAIGGKHLEVRILADGAGQVGGNVGLRLLATEAADSTAGRAAGGRGASIPMLVPVRL